LAIFAANPEEILVENSSSSGKIRLYLNRDRFKKSAPVNSSSAAGTGITIMSSHRDVNREKQLLEVFCRSVSREVRLNNRSIGGQSFLFGQMAAIKLLPSKHAGVFLGQIGIPQTGENCHFRFLDQGIPWHHFTLPPQKGFIFDAAVETVGEVTGELIDHLCQYAHRLYQWLCQRYTTASPVIRDRIEELLFTHCRLSGDESFVLQFAPFKIFNSRRSLNLSQIRVKAAAGSLYAVPVTKDRLRYNTAHKTVLSLTREQADFLINHLHIPITFLNPGAYRENPLPKIWYTWKKRIKRFIVYLLPAPKKVLKTDQLTKSEELFIVTLLRYLSRQGELRGSHDAEPQVLLIPSRGPFPSIPLKRNKKELLIRRDHPVVKKAIRAVQTDPRNIEIFVPLLIY
ncbi:MAG: hypothetical protein JSV88_30220, partial [Candidatus Aminicenantes bacterium]